MKRLLWLGVLLLVALVLYQLMSAKKSCYAPPRDENTILPYIENFMANMPDSQTEVYKDAAGFLNQREHPLTDFFQANAYSGTDMGTFSSLESSAGNMAMYVIPKDEQYSYGQVDETRCKKSVLLVTDTQEQYGPGTYSGVTLTGDIHVWAPLSITATGPGGAKQVMTYRTNDACPEREHLVLDKKKTFDTLILTVEPQSEIIECRRSIVLNPLTQQEYKPGRYSGLSLKGELDVWPPLTVTATGPGGARQVITYQTSEACPLESRLVLDSEKTFDTLLLEIPLNGTSLGSTGGAPLES